MRFQPLSAGGGSGPDAGGLRFVVNGQPALSPPLSVYVNGPDLDASGRVDLSDLVLFAADYRAGSAFRSDYYWDGRIDLSDLVILAEAAGADCP